MKKVYINPIPFIDAGKDFIFELNIKLDDITEIEHAKEIVADYILSLPKEKIVKGLKCKKIEPVYPERVITKE